MIRFKMSWFSIGMVAIVILLIAGIGFVYSYFNSPQKEFARNEIKQLDKINKFVDVRAKISKDYGKKAEDKKQSLEFKYDLFSLDIYKDGLNKHSAIYGKSSFLGKKIDTLVVEKDDVMKFDMNFYKRIVEVPNKLINKQLNEVSKEKVDISLNDFVESFFFTSKKNPYNLTDSQIKDLYTSIDKNAFTKDGRTITLTLNKDNLVKLTEKARDIIVDNSKDNKFNKSTLDSLVNKAKNAKGDVIIRQMKVDDETIHRTIEWSNNRVDINVTANNDGFRVNVIEKNNEILFSTEKQGDKFKDVLQFSVKNDKKDVSQSRIELTSDKVSDSEYKIEGYSRQYTNGIQDIKNIKGYVKTYDKSLELKLEMERTDSIFLKYSYDVIMPYIDKNRDIVKVNENNLDSVMFDIQKSISEFISK